MGACCANLTDDLPSKIKRIGEALVQEMSRSKRNAEKLNCIYDMAEARIDGILTALSILGLPYKVRWQGERDKYIAIEIAGETFYVEDSPDADADNGEPEGT